MAVAVPTESRNSIDPGTSMGTVSLTVADLARSRDFYERATGLVARDADDGTVAIGPPGGPALVSLHGDSTAPPLDHGRTGLYHLAVLLPSRRDLAAALVRLAKARWPLSGASDHLVSEALYLSDPDGNGIELYRDRPRDEWPMPDGRIEMATLPLDLDGLVAELGGATAVSSHVPDGTVIGHVHLQVANLDAAEAFYSGVLGFDVTVRGYPGALFVSAGGYHHHLGLNTWHSAGAEPPAEGSIGLRSFEVAVPDGEALEAVLGRVAAAGIHTEAVHDKDAVLVRDPSGNGLILRSRKSD
jgi:catechol 2,3-dioxygenase